MADEPQPTPTPTPDPAAVVPEPGPAPSPPEPGSTPEPAQPRFVPADRFDAVVGQKYEAIRRAEGLEARAKELEARLAQFEARNVASPPLQPGAAGTTIPQDPSGTRTFQGPISQTELDRLANLRAQQMRFNEKCNESVAAGRKTYVDFDAKVDDLRKVAPTVDAQGRPMLPESLISAALATGRAHEVLYALGSDQGEADRIMSINDPTSQAVEVAKFAMALKPAGGEGIPLPMNEPKTVPDPIRPVVGGSRKISVKDMELDDPNLPIEEFIRRRDEQAATRRRPNGRFR